MTRKTFLLLLFCLAWPLLLAAQSPPINPFLKQPDRPNIILIVADDLGYGELGSYGQKKIQTPHLDRMAAEGMRFTQFYAGSTVCAPSRAVFMTGLHTGNVRIRGNTPRVPLAKEDLTIAELLKHSGYATCAIGKWGLGLEPTPKARLKNQWFATPNQKGFEEWFGYIDQQKAHDYFPEQLWRNDDLIQLERNLYGNKGDYSHHFFARASLNYAAISRNKPFFLYLAYTIPHANSRLGRETGNGMEIPSDEPYSAMDWPQPEKNKAAMITLLDRDIGRLFEVLKEHGLDENTVVFFTSDNGPHKAGGNDPAFFNASGPFRGIKRDLYEGGIRVPMIVRWPGKIPAGEVSDQVWAAWDFLPTAAEIAHIPPPRRIDGISMLPTLLGKKQTNQHAFLYWEFHEQGSKQAVRMGDWKALRQAPGAPLELYYLKNDPGESRNVAGENAAIIERIEAYLKSARTESEHWPLRSAPTRKETKS
jgi:arylsulfatase A-like enzyme